MDLRYVSSGWCGKHRSITLSVGVRCRVEPLSPQTKKNRGRICTVVGFRKFGGSEELAAVIWEDTGKYGGAEMGDLVLAPASDPAEACGLPPGVAG